MTEQQACTLCGAGGHTAAQCHWREQEAFEEAVAKRQGKSIAWVASHRDESTLGYMAASLQHAWWAWQARAALAQPSPGEDMSAAQELAGVKAILNDVADVLKRLTFHARTTGGTAGHDAALIDACNRAERALSLGGMGASFMRGCDEHESKPSPAPALDRHQASAAVRAAKESKIVTLADGRASRVIDGDEDAGCLWVLPEGGEEDIRVWASQIARVDELDLPEVVAWKYEPYVSGEHYGKPKLAFVQPYSTDRHVEPLMTVTQHDRIAAVRVAEIEELDGLVKRLGDLLSQVAIVLRGPEPALTRYGYADLPQRVKALMDERDAAQARVAELEAERNAALEKVAELEGQSGVEFVYDSDELVAVPRGLLGAACHAIDKKLDAPRTIAKLREYARGIPAPVAQAGQVPEGWKLVPTDPTSQMTFVGQSLRYDALNSIGEIYRQMIASAPSQGGPSHE